VQRSYFLPGLAALLLVLSASAILSSAIPSVSAGPDCNADPALDSEEAGLLRRINDYRADHGLTPLVVSTSLSRSAAWKAQHMADLDYLAHDDPGTGRGWPQRIQDCGYLQSAGLGEVLTGGEGGGESPFNIWTNSPAHDDQILGTGYRAIGIGRAYNGTGQPEYYWAADLATEVDASISGGDADCDGRTDARDAALILQYAANMIDSLPCPGNADADASGAVNAADAMLVLQYDAGFLG
jgi:uncharacterized protein YkwD